MTFDKAADTSAARIDSEMFSTGSQICMTVIVLAIIAAVTLVQMQK